MEAKYQINEPDKIISICGHCHPGNSAWAIPALAPLLLQDYSLSAGVCPQHAAEMRTWIANLRARRVGSFGPVKC